MHCFDLHCDTIGECAMRDISLRSNTELHISLDRGSSLRPWFQCFAAWIPDTEPHPLQYFRKIAAKLQNEIMQNPDKIILCCKADDLYRAKKEKKCGAVFTVEGGSVLEKRLETLEELANCHVKVMTLTWNAANELGGGALEPGGLTSFGRDALKEMARLQIVPDVSHASDPLFWDVMEYAEGPVIATHSNARALCNHPRNLTDEQFSALKERGGLVGLNFYTAFLKESGKAYAQDILRHAEHFLALGGENTVALGSDFDGAEMPEEITGIESIEMLAELFARHGYSDSLIERIFYQNSFAFFEKHMSDEGNCKDPFDKRKDI